MVVVVVVGCTCQPRGNVSVLKQREFYYPHNSATPEETVSQIRAKTLLILTRLQLQFCASSRIQVLHHNFFPNFQVRDRELEVLGPISACPKASLPT